MKITVSSQIEETPRVEQIRGMFDLAPEKTSSHAWDVDLPLTQQSWNIGLIVGPSGCGKSTIARNLWPQQYDAQAATEWSPALSILDGFPSTLPVKDVTALLSSVGFSSPPSWLKPFTALSTGQQFRVSLARMIAQNPNLSVCDEYTSVVDRTVAQIGSAAVAKVIREKNRRFIAITCHEDVEPWLNPDWVYRPAVNEFTWRSLQRRPDITLEVFRCKQQAWKLFAPHHYLSGELATSAVCFMAVYQNRPAAFSSWMQAFSIGPSTKREHRTVCLPDFQGVGIGNTVSNTIASMYAGLDYKVTSTTTHPSMVNHRKRSKDWLMVRAPGLGGAGDSVKHSMTRFTAGFRYVGKPMKKFVAKQLLAQ